MLFFFFFLWIVWLNFLNDVILYEYFVIFFEIILGLCLNNIVFFRMVSLVLLGIIILWWGRGNFFWICFCRIGDLENLLIINIVFILWYFSFFNNRFLMWLIMLMYVKEKKFLKNVGVICSLFFFYFMFLLYIEFLIVFFNFWFFWFL